MTEQFANFAQGTLTSPITANQTILSITPTALYNGQTSIPNNFPLLGNFRITVQSFDVTTQIPISAPEIMLVTAVSANTFTVQRGVEGTQAIAFASGAQVRQTCTAAVMQALAAGGNAISRSINNISNNTNAGITASIDYVYLCTGTITLTLPTAIGNKNLYTIKNIGSGTVTLNTTSSQSIDGSTSLSLVEQYQGYTVVSNNSNWSIVA